MQNDTSRTRSFAIVCSCALAAATEVVVAGTEPEWTIYKPSNTGIPGDVALDVFIDSEGNPWIPGYITFWEEGGIARWNEEDNTWFVVSNVDYPMITSPRFNDTDQDANGMMWIGTESGLLRYDPSIGPESLVRYDEFNTPMPGDQVSQVSIAPDGTIWLAIHNHGEVPPGGLVQFDPVQDEWNVWTTATGLPWGEEWPGWDWIDFVAAAPDYDGGYTVYFGSSEMGAASYKDGVFRSFELEPSTPQIYAVAGDDAVDNLGYTWLKTDAGFVRRHTDGTMEVMNAPITGTVEAFADGRAGLFNLFGEVYTYEDGVGWVYRGNWNGGSHTYTIAEEAPGKYWVGGIGGVARYESGFWQRYRLTNTGMLGFFMETIDFDEEGNVYMNGNAGPGVGGFTIFDGERWTCVNNFNYGLGPVWGQPSDDVDILCTRSDGTLALDVHVGGLQGWNGASYFPINPVWNTFALDEDTLGRLWSGNVGRLFLYEDGKTILFDDDSSPMLGFDVNRIRADLDNPGFIWLSTGLGVIHTDGETWEVYPREMIDLTQFSIGHFISDAAPAGDGAIWIGTGLGLYHFDPVTEEYDVYTPANTPLPSDEIDHVIVTPDGSVWVTTFDSTFPYPGGLTRFDGEEWQTWTMTDSPLPHNQVWELTWREVDGGYEVWIGTASEGVAVVTVAMEPAADLDGDGVVSFSDLLALLAAWGPCGNGPCAADLDQSGDVGFSDLLVLLTNWS